MSVIWESSDLKNIVVEADRDGMIETGKGIMKIWERLQ